MLSFYMLPIQYCIDPFASEMTDDYQLVDVWKQILTTALGWGTHFPQGGRFPCSPTGAGAAHDLDLFRMRPNDSSKKIASSMLRQFSLRKRTDMSK